MRSGRITFNGKRASYCACIVRGMGAGQGQLTIAVEDLVPKKK